MNDQNRVLGRRGARQLSVEEIDRSAAGCIPKPFVQSLPQLARTKTEMPPSASAGQFANRMKSFGPGPTGPNDEGEQA